MLERASSLLALYITLLLSDAQGLLEEAEYCDSCTLVHKIRT